MTTSTDPTELTTGRPEPGDATGLYVVASTIVVAEVGCAALETAFRHRLRAVEATAGFRGLQVWRESHQPGQYLMVSWWASREHWAAYMRSTEHDESHARMPTSPARPRPGGLRTFEVVAT